MLVRKKKNTAEIIEGQNNSPEEENSGKKFGISSKRDQRAVKLGRHSLQRDTEKSETIAVSRGKAEHKG